MFNSYFFIINPAAGAGKKLNFLSQLANFFNNLKIDFSVAITKQSKEAISIAKRVGGKYEVVVAVGGDGTVNEVVNGLVGSKSVLGVLPIGSGNDFARQIGMSGNFSEDIRILASSRTKAIDLGVVNWRYYFTNAFGVGFDAVVARRVQKDKNRGGGIKAYLKAVFKELSAYNFPWVKISSEKEILTDQQILLAAVCNGTTYGGGFRISPGAKMDDGIFNVCIIDKLPKLTALIKIPKLVFGTHLDMEQVHTYGCQHVSFYSNDILVSQADGEILPELNKFDVEIIPKAIKVITR